MCRKVEASAHDVRSVVATNDKWGTGVHMALVRSRDVRPGGRWFGTLPDARELLPPHGNRRVFVRKGISRQQASGGFAYELVARDS